MVAGESTVCVPVNRKPPSKSEPRQVGQIGGAYSPRSDRSSRPVSPRLIAASLRLSPRRRLSHCIELVLPLCGLSQPVEVAHEEE